MDRLLSNPALSLEALLGCWVEFVVVARREIFVNFDWTECEASDQSILVLVMQTEHGRSTPLVWKTLHRSALKDQRNDHEDDLLTLFARLVPPGVRVNVVADRGFGDSKLYEFLSGELGFDYLIRFRAVVHVAAESGERRNAGE